MKVSIFTPTHDATYLRAAYDSIKHQKFDEWVIVSNNGAEVPQEIIEDNRVKVFEARNIKPYVGALKRHACERTTGDILVELDHDDLLTPDAISEIKRAFEEDQEVGFVYSNSCNFQGDFQKTEKYGYNFGWKYRDFHYNGHVLNEAIAFNEYPSGLTKIWYCPNHVRAWSRKAYFDAGGHPPEMRVLDDQDLVARTYLVTKFKHIDKCLYLYRITGNNTWLKYNDEIQSNVLRIRSEYLEKVALKWSENNHLFSLDMGAAHNPREGFSTCDIVDGCDFKFDASEKWPFEDNSVGILRMYDFMEHIPDKIHLINEAYRVLAHGGIILSETPSTDGRGAFQDPTHCAFYNEHSFWYYTREDVQKFVPEIKAKFQEEDLQTFEKRPNIPYVRAHLVAVKKDDLPGTIHWKRS